MWTKPCVISQIVKNSPADLCHLETGDFIIFIDKVNIVDKTPTEILDLITNVDVLTLEVFRRAKTKITNVLPRIISTETKVDVNINLPSVNEDDSAESVSYSEIKSVTNCEIVKSIPNNGVVVKSQSESKREVPIYVEVIKKTPIKLPSKSSTELKRKQLVTFSKDEVSRVFK